MVAPAAARTGEVTRLLRAARAGDASAIDRIVPLVYEDLRRVARRQLGRGFGNESVRPTELVHDAYVKLSIGGAAAAVDRAHFLAIAARAMRQVLVDHARRRGARKRLDGVERVTFDDDAGHGATASFEVLALHEALERFTVLDARAAQVVEARVFGGMTTQEVAHVLKVSTRTVELDWTVARRWLARELRAGADGR